MGGNGARSDEEEIYIYIDAPATRRIPISPNSYFAYTPLRQRPGVRKEDDVAACSPEAMHSSAQMTEG